MKKIIYLLAIVITTGIVESTLAFHASPMRPKPIKVRVRHPSDCDRGFGVCLILRGEPIGISPFDAAAECYYENSKLVINFAKSNLSNELMEKFANERTLPIEKDFYLTEEIFEYLDLPQNAALKAGRYEVIDADDFFQITIPIVN